MATSLGRTIEHADGRRSIVLDISQTVPLFERIAAFLAEHGAAIEHWSRHHPSPLSIDGNVYRRRRRARARRNR